MNRGNSNNNINNKLTIVVMAIITVQNSSDLSGIVLKGFIHFFPFNFHSDPTKSLLVSPFYRGKDWGSTELKQYK